VNLEIDISLKNDEKLISILEVIGQIMKRLVRLGEPPVIDLLSSLEGSISRYLAE
jgi:hypothetical protein